MNDTVDALSDRSDERGVTRRDGFGGSMALSAETAASAGAAQAAALVQARYVMALQRPRVWDDVRNRLLRECSRVGFAEVAGYSKPVGTGTVSGLSIRFAEVAIRCMTNVQVSSFLVFEDARQRVLRVTVADLEGNTPYETDVTVTKTVERSKLKDGQVALGVRTNSAWQKTYLVEATDDDLLNKQNALISKAIRTAALRLLPGDIQDDCRAALIKTAAGHAKANPDHERRRLVDSFAEINVWAADLQQYLGHAIDKLNPDEIVELRQVFSGIRDGETTWAEVIEARKEAKTPKRDAEKEPAKTPNAKVDALAGAPQKTEASSTGAAPAPKEAPGNDPREGLIAECKRLENGMPPAGSAAAYATAGLSESALLEDLDVETLERLRKVLLGVPMGAVATKPTEHPAPNLIELSNSVRAKSGNARFDAIVKECGGTPGRIAHGLTTAGQKKLRAALEAELAKN